MKLVIFDFDGVLVNTSELSYKIHKIKNQDFTWERFQDYSTGNFHDGYDKAVADGSHIHPEDYYEKYKEGLDVMNIHEILHESILFLAKNYRLAIVSSTFSSYIQDFLAKEKLAECFYDILGADVHKSKVFKLKSLLEKYNIAADETVFITDTLGDIKEANEVGVPSIAVTWGLHNKETLEKGNPVKIIDDPQDLIDAIEGVLK